jgi:hypothetical protein
MYQFLSNECIHNKTVDSLNFLRSTLKQVAFSSFYSFRSNLSRFHQKSICLLRNLSSDKDLVVTKMDKGNGVVLLDRRTYLDKMNQVLGDTSKFVLCCEDWIKLVFRCEDKVNRFIDNVFKSGAVIEHQKKMLKISGSRAGIMYGLPKVHKSGIPLRPILSTVGTYN